MTLCSKLRSGVEVVMGDVGKMKNEWEKQSVQMCTFDSTPVDWKKFEEIFIGYLSGWISEGYLQEYRKFCQAVGF